MVKSLPAEGWVSWRQIGPQANESGPISSYPYGAGVVLRTAILRKAYGLGFKSLLSDRKGNTLSSGGDGEIAEWLAILDTGNWYYNSELQFFHFIETPRLNKTYLYRLSNGFGQMTPILRIYQRFRAQKPTVDPSIVASAVCRIDMGDEKSRNVCFSCWKDRSILESKRYTKLDRSYRFDFD